MGALVVAVFRLGQAVHSWPAGALAAVLAVTSPSVLLLGPTAAKDIPFCVLVVAALVLEVRRPRRGEAVMALLALAGLLRPEAWLLAGAYWLHVARSGSGRERLRTAGLALLGPAVWILTDLAVTGEPFFSLTRTRALTAELGRETGFANVPSALAGGLADVITAAGVVGGAAGLALALRVEARRAAAPASLVALASAGFVAIGVAGLPLGTRYLLLPGMVLAAFCGLAALGWLSLDGGREKRAWAGGGALLLVALAATAPGRAEELERVNAILQYEKTLGVDLRALHGETRTARVLARCPRIYFYAGDYDVLVPYLSYDLDRPADDFASLQAEQASQGAVVLRRERQPPHDFRLEGENASWRVYSRGCSVRRE